MASEAISEGKTRDLCSAVIAIVSQLEWMARALESNNDTPAALVLGSITQQLDSLVEPLDDLQKEVRHG